MAEVESLPHFLNSSPSRKRRPQGNERGEVITECVEFSPTPTGHARAIARAFIDPPAMLSEADPPAQVDESDPPSPDEIRHVPEENALEARVARLVGSQTEVGFVLLLK